MFLVYKIVYGTKVRQYSEMRDAFFLGEDGRGRGEGEVEAEGWIWHYVSWII
jgi:hypothetical protein